MPQGSDRRAVSSWPRDEPLWHTSPEAGNGPQEVSELMSGACIEGYESLTSPHTRAQVSICDDYTLSIRVHNVVGIHCLIPAKACRESTLAMSSSSEAQEFSLRPKDGSLLPEQRHQALGRQRLTPTQRLRALKVRLPVTSRNRNLYALSQADSSLPVFVRAATCRRPKRPQARPRNGEAPSIAIVSDHPHPQNPVACRGFHRRRPRARHKTRHKTSSLGHSLFSGRRCRPPPSSCRRRSRRC